MLGLEKSFPMMYSNLGLSFRWTLPLSVSTAYLVPAPGKC